MSLCINSTTLVFNGERADDGGVPEELTIVITKYCTDPSPNFEVEEFDSRYDSEFTFKPPTDGVYEVEYIGGVTGSFYKQDFLVKFHADNEVGRLASEYVNKLMCNSCIDALYMYKKSLIEMAVALSGCGKYCSAEDLLLSVLDDDCGNKIKDCGCS